MLALALACTVMSSCAAKGSLVTFTPESPRNYLFINLGTGSDFKKAGCVELGTIHDSDPTFDARDRLAELFRTRIPGLPRCKGAEASVLVISEYESGRGVCIDCGTGTHDPQSGFAFLSMKVDGKADIAMAEWQYWRGGTAEFMLEQFVFDVTNLWTNGVSKSPL